MIVKQKLHCSYWSPIANCALRNLRSYGHAINTRLRQYADLFFPALLDQLGALEVVRHERSQGAHSIGAHNIKAGLSITQAQIVVAEDDALGNLRRDFAERPNEEKEARFLFRTAELESIDRERIIRLDIKLDID